MLCRSAENEQCCVQSDELGCQAAEAGVGVEYLGVGMEAGVEEREAGDEKAISEVSSQYCLLITCISKGCSAGQIYLLPIMCTSMSMCTSC